jgi:hypothetical protein
MNDAVGWGNSTIQLVAIELVWPLAHPGGRLNNFLFIKLSLLYCNKTIFFFLASVIITGAIYCSKAIQPYLKISAHDSLCKIFTITNQNNKITNTTGKRFLH